ncbi:ABC transporter permease [Deferribacter thermophilus]|uniref:ABC transporter permease n=1 Tax=Deferribacter thermophilus TaxID=53573 RepID=UPI003C22F0DC
MIKGVYGVYLRELLVLKSRFWKVILSSAISPLLFLLAFGYGIGRSSQIDGFSYVSFLIPGLITMSSMNQAYGISTEINISRFYFKVFDEFLLAPIPKWQIVIGEVLYGITKGVVPVTIVLVYGIIIGVKLNISIYFIFSVMLHLVTFSLLGFIIALIVKNHGDQFSVNTFVITPMIFLSGTFYPVDKMPVVVKYIAYAFPLTYSTSLIRNSLLLKTISFYYVFILFVIVIFLYLIAIRIVNNLETA